MRNSFAIALLGLVAAIAPLEPAGAQTANPESPQAGTYPILFNDRHVNASPDGLKRGRVLAALVKAGTILVPLRSMFEQMGATVSYDPATKTAEVSKSGADVKVTVGKPEVVYNGETRPLDVPPLIVDGVVMVPVRVISESMGAYVEWVADRKVVAVRYLEQPAPTPAPSAPPSEAPAPAAAPAAPTLSAQQTAPPQPRPTHGREFFVAGDYAYAGSVRNEFSPGNDTGASFTGRAAAEVPVGKLAAMAEADFRTWQYTHFTGPVTTIGGTGSTIVPAFDAHDTDAEYRLGVGLPFPRVFIGGSYIDRYNNYGYANQHGFGFGIEKLPDFDQKVFSLFGSFYYFPEVGDGAGLQYSMYTYQGGVEVHPVKDVPLFVETGYMGDVGNVKVNSPASFEHQGGFVGIGLHF